MSTALVPSLPGTRKLTLGDDPRRPWTKRPPSDRLRLVKGWRTLRHWTTSSASFVGAQQTPCSDFSDRPAADSFRLNLLASKLRLVKRTAGEQIEHAQ
jgi:hypothetical protein